MIKLLNKIRGFFGIASLFFLFTTSSCSNLLNANSEKSSVLSFLEKTAPKWLTPYKADIVQGNYISENMILLLKKGHTKEQVKIILGTPLLVDPFKPSRWDYVFNIKKNNGTKENRSFFVEFENDKLFHWEGKVVESSLEANITPN